MDKSRTLLLALLTVTATLLVPNMTQAHAVNTFQKCDLFASLRSDSKIAWWRPDKCGIPTSMTLQGVLQAPGITGVTGGGMTFNVPGCALGPGKPCLYATEFTSDTVAIFDNTGTFLSTCGTGYNRDPESIFIDTKSSPGAIYVGQPDGTHHVLKFNLDCSTGTPAFFSPATEGRGTDWIDLVAPDSSDGGSLCDMQYTSEGTHVLTFDLCSNTQEANLNSLPLPGSNAYAHRQLTTDHSVLVGDTEFVAHLDSSGSLINTCDSNSRGTLFALNILPGSTEFVTADITGNFSGRTDYFTIAHCDAGNIAPDFTFDAIPAGGGEQVGGLAVFGEVTATTQGLTVSKFFTDSSLNPLPLDSNRNPVVNVTLAGGIVRSTNPGQVLAWVNVTNIAGVPLQSLKVNETLPVDWTVDPPWRPAVGAIHVFFANTTSLATNPDITQPSTITVSTGNPETVLLAIANFTDTAIVHPLMPGQSILLSVKLTYGLIRTSQSAASYPRNYTDTASVATWTQPFFTGTEFSGNSSGFFIAVAIVLGKTS